MCMFHNKSYLLLTSAFALFFLGSCASQPKADQTSEAPTLQTSEVPALYILKDSNNKCDKELPTPANQEFSVDDVNGALDALLARTSDSDSVILYVHGRAVKLKEADKSLRSVMPCIENENNAKVLMFYWPGAGNGGTLGFPEEEARQAGKVLGEVVSGLQKYKEQNKAQFDNKRTVLLLHSMGNIVFEEFIDKHQSETLNSDLFDTVILSSSATKTKDHASWLSQAEISKNTYVMVNKHDPVLSLLGPKYIKGRLGKKLKTIFARNVKLAENAIYVNLDDAGIDGHRYFTNSGQKGNEDVAKFFDAVLAGHPVDLDSYPGVTRERRDGTSIFYFK
jgi:Alpha/beta hydrolase of unknown function (DUF900)